MESKCRLTEIINCDLPAVIEHLLKDDIRSQEHKDNILNDINWLIERVQNLESRLAFEQGVTSNLQSKNKRYREALEKIDDIMRLKRRWNKEDMHIMNALKALEGEE